MKKAKPLSVVIPELIDCDYVDCKEGVVVSGIFNHKNPCFKCDGSGKLDKNTGNAVDPVLMVYTLNEQIKKLKAEIKVLEANQKPLAEFNPYGDVSNRHGGKFRMD